MTKTFLIITLIFSFVSSAQNRFTASISQLETDFDYYPETINGNKNYVDKSQVAKWFKKSKENCLRNNPKLENLNFDEFIKVKSADIRSKKPLEGNIYLRITIEEWTFNNEKSATTFENKLKSIDLNCINKGGVEFWRIKENIYLIISPATRFSYEFESIKNSMNKALK